MIAQMSTTDSHLPDYDGLLRAYHASHRDLVKRILDELPVTEADRILDVACGDGFYTRLLAERFSPPGEVIGVDVSAAYLEEARRSLQSLPPGARVRAIQADAYDLPFDEGTVDLVWCAQSMLTLKDPVRSLREMHRVLKPGAVAAILENNQLHYVLLPWPAALEIAVEHARLASRERRRRGGEDFARVSLGMLHAAGLTPLAKRTYAADFLGPQDGAVLTFIEEYFRSLEEDIEGLLAPAAAEQWHALTDPASPHYLPRQNDFELSCLTVVTAARKDERGA